MRSPQRGVYLRLPVRRAARTTTRSQPLPIPVKGAAMVVVPGRATVAAMVVVTMAAQARAVAMVVVPGRVMAMVAARVLVTETVVVQVPAMVAALDRGQEKAAMGAELDQRQGASTRSRVRPCRRSSLSSRLL